MRKLLVLLVVVILLPILFLRGVHRVNKAAVRPPPADTVSVEAQGVDMRFRARDTTRRLGPGDVRITSVDRNIELALIGDSVVTGLGPKVLEEIRVNTDSASVHGNGLGASIERMVKNTVAGALSHQLLVPVHSISDVRYQDGRLSFYKSDGSRMHLYENTKDSGRDTSMMFTTADANRFIDAFHARKAARP